jgi:L-alanine-DL-glutamate epimerase-like enolase superfamily enzyme
VVEYQTGVAYIEELTSPPCRLDGDGLLPLPTGPGLGVGLNPDAIARYSRQG